jgi:hypothetical protein
MARRLKKELSEDDSEEPLRESSSQVPSAPAVPHGAVPWYVVLSYCMVSWSLEMTATQWSTFTTIYFTDTALLNPGYGALIALFYRMWSVVMDP